VRIVGFLCFFFYFDKDTKYRYYLLERLRFPEANKEIFLYWCIY